MKLQPKTLAVLIAGMFTAGVVNIVNAQTAPAPAADKKDEKKTTELGTVRVTGEGDKLGNGNIIQEESTKGRSTATRAAIDKVRSTSNPFQVIELLPGVNTASVDATGLFAGALRVRGFNSDQLGFTVDGAPVNDSGNFAVFPQEYVDAENLEEVFVTQGSADTEAPHVGATGGNVGIVSSNPTNQRRIRVSQTVGQLDLSRTYLRFDTGLIGPFKAFLSYSNSKANKFRGAGGADRDHIDYKANFDLGKGSSLQFTALYNRAINNNYLSACKVDFQTFGNSLDFSQTYLPNVVAANGQASGVATNTFCRNNGSTAPTVTVNGQTIATPYPYYKLSLNPFRNAVLTAKGYFAVLPNLRLDVEPYYWFGYGTGGIEQTILSEATRAAAGARFRGGLADITGNGTTTDTTTVYRGSVTRTKRPGVTLKANWQFGNNRIVAGYWFERAQHRQTQPATTVSAGGESANVWLNNAAQLVRRLDGSLYQGRDWNTISTADSFFIQDTISFLNDKLTITPAIKTPRIKRDFTNYASDGANSGVDYNVVRTYKETNPSIGIKYAISDSSQVFGNITRGSRVPSNFIAANKFFGATLVNGVFTGGALNVPDLKAETSVTTEVGYRYLSDAFTFSSTIFGTQFKNRLTQQFDPNAQTTLDVNLGDSTIRGLELEVGTRPIYGFSAYASLTYTKSKIKNDLLSQSVSVINPTTANPFGSQTLITTIPTSGREFPDTPNWLAGLTLQYVDGPFLLSLSNKYTGKQYDSLTNDGVNSGRFLTDLNAAYKFPNTDWVRNTTIRFNVSNLFNKTYYTLSQGSGSSFTLFNSLNGRNIQAPASYFVGSPRFASVSLAVDF